MKTPAFQFYPGDWKRDTALQACSIAARGLWVDLMCIAHDCEEYGVLQIGDRPMTNDTLSRMVGLQLSEFNLLLSELELHRVFSRKRNGAIYSRRMVKDAKLRDIRSKAGSKGGSKTQANHQANGQANLKQTVADADAVADAIAEEEFESFWNELSSGNAPHPVKKPAAFLAFLENVPRGSLEMLRVALANYRESDQVKRGYVKNASTWLADWRVYLPKPRIVSPRDEMQSRIDMWEMEHPRPINPAEKSDWLAAFEATFGFTLEQWKWATDEEIEAWLRRSA